MGKLERLDPYKLADNPRCNLSAWNRYQPYVQNAYRNHPRSFTFKPTSLASATVASRIREAIRGALVFSYPGFVTTAELARWYSEVVVTHVGDSVTIGPRTAVSEPLKAETPTSGFTYTTLTPAEFNAFVTLLSTGRLLGPVCIRQPDPHMLSSVENVEVIQRPDGSIVLI